MAGLALMYALDLTRFLKHGTNMASKSEADFNSVERIGQVPMGRRGRQRGTAASSPAPSKADWTAAIERLEML